MRKKPCLSLRKPRLLILSEPRSGSNNLTYSLNAHPELNVDNELFHPRNGIKKSEFSEIIKINSTDTHSENNVGHWINHVSEKMMLKTCESLFSEMNGFKVHTEHLSAERLCKIATFFDCKILISYRRDAFEQAISNFIATKRGVWHADEKHKKRGEAFEIAPAAIENWILKLYKARSRHWKALKAANIPILLCEYERMYSGSFDCKVKRMLEIFNMLELKLPGEHSKQEREKIYSKLKYYLDSGHQKVSTNSLKSELILNYNELKAKNDVWFMNSFRYNNIL